MKNAWADSRFSHPAIFGRFWLPIFPFFMSSRNWKLHKPLKLTKSFTFEPILYRRRRFLEVILYANAKEQKRKR